MTHVLRAWKPDPSHVMGKETSEIRQYGSEPRFYGVAACLKCHAEYAFHPAGRWADHALSQPCQEGQ